jgi:hypothetical protein
MQALACATAMVLTIPSSYLLTEQPRKFESTPTLSFKHLQFGLSCVFDNNQHSGNNAEVIPIRGRLEMVALLDNVGEQTA